MAIIVRKGGEFLRSKTRWWKRLFSARARRYMAGRRGEEIVANELARLSRRFYVVNDVQMGQGGGNLDHVVVGPRGIVALETKYHAGEVRGREGGRWKRRPLGKGWFRGGWTEAPDPTEQVRRAASRLEARLWQEPDLAAWGPQGRLRVSPALVYAHPRCRIRVNSRVVKVVRLPGARRQARKGSGTRLSPAERRQLAAAIADFSGRSRRGD